MSWSSGLFANKKYKRFAHQKYLFKLKASLYYIFTNFYCNLMQKSLQTANKALYIRRKIDKMLKGRQNSYAL